ncbi:beta strand repeat-containing protein [Nocardioides marmorisolisilvae]|uniref:beta strand repeat-containing protein n=1 Tax=Nocardioides marmorisolisilvae TaxID=1542737 RepID=UPI0011CE23CE|nr:Ig-like domain-containing protein [Nocardioides marmorisolisilvae]
MRKLTAAFAALAAGVGLALVVSPAEASITTPSSGATVAGIVNITSTGGDDTSTLDHCGGNTSTKIELITTGGAQVSPAFNNTKSGSGSYTVQLNTRSYANGSYQIRVTETDGKNGSFLINCASATPRVFTQPVTITNVSAAAYTGTVFSAPQNTSVPVEATFTDPNNTNAGIPNLPVTFSLTGGGSVTATTNASGVASASLPVSGPPRTGATLTASTTGNTFFAGSSTTKSFDVTKNSTSTTLSQPVTIVHGQSTSFTATVARTNGSTGTPTGTVQFKLDGNDYALVTLDGSGVATTSPDAGLSTGSHTITAVYNGDSNFIGSTAADKTLTINKASTTTSLTDAPSPTVSGQGVTFTAHVDIVSPGVGTLGGAVQFNIDGQPFGTAVALGAGDNATLTVSNLSTGNHNVVAVYNGNADFATSSSATVTHGVNKADTTLDLTTSNPNAVSGEPLTFTAQVAPVSPGAGTITGTVQFAVDGVNLGAPVTVSGGQAVSPVTHLTVGDHNVTANYSGDDNFAGQSDALTQNVDAAHTTTSISSSPNPSVHGQNVTVHAEVTPIAPATGHPTGTIKFIVDGANYGFVDMVNGAADITVTGLSTDSHTIKAVYLSDDLNFFTSTSETITQVVNKASTKTTLTSSSPTAVFGQPVTFTASVSVLAPGAGSPSGTIVFKDGSTVIGTQPVSSATGEQASITVSNLSVAQHAISAAYSGDDDFNASTGNVSQTVTRAQTSTVISSSANPAASGQGVQFTATVTPVAPGAGNPTGTVRFFVNGANLGSPAAVVDGVATSPNFASLTPGIYKITATYSGDGNFVGSDGVLDQGAGQNVTKGNTSITVSSGPAAAAYGSAVTVTTDVTAVAPAQRKPTGVVQIWEGDELLGSSSLAPTSAATTSEATFVTTGLSAGAHSLTAVYVGNFNFNGSSASTTQTVGQIPTVTGIASSGTPAVYGDTISFTATVNTSAGTPTGSVTFKEGSTVLGTAPVGDGGQATLSVAGLHTGTHTVKATYSGDVSHSGSTSGGFDQVITKAPTTIVAADTNNPGNGVPPRQNWIRAKLTDRYGNPMPGRTVSFSSAPIPARPAQHLCDAVTDANGIAECNDQVFMLDINLTPGETLLDIVSAYDATYAGDADTIGDTARGHEY